MAIGTSKIGVLGERYLFLRVAQLLMRRALLQRLLAYKL